MHRVLIVGAAGQVGAEVQRKAANRPDIHVIPLTRHDADIRDSEQMNRMIDHTAPDLVVNCAAYNWVDKAESEAEIAFAVNHLAPQSLAALCDKAGVGLVHFSSDYVFDGRKDSPYDEDDTPNPLGTYAKSKLAGERAVLEGCPRALVIRTAWVYASHGTNFVRTMLRLGKERKEIRVVDDQRGTPTAAADIASMVLSCVPNLVGPQARYGLYHYAGTETLTWCGWARRVFDGWRELTCQPIAHLTPIPAAQYHTPSPRPANTALDSSRMARDFAISPSSFGPALRTVLSELVNKED